jgi:predicted methyltransferase
MSYHDLYYVDEAGGSLLIIDHAAAAGAGNSGAGKTHRIEEAFAKRDIESHGFRLEKTWGGYRNSADDLSKLVFDPKVRGKTDRFTHLYRRR